jgi:hypothetical protein
VIFQKPGGHAGHDRGTPPDPLRHHSRGQDLASTLIRTAPYQDTGGRGAVGYPDTSHRRTSSP